MSDGPDERDMIRQPAIAIGSVGQLRALGMGLRVFCPHCRRIEDINLSTLDPATRYVGARFRCTACGAPGRMTVLANTTPR